MDVWENGLVERYVKSFDTRWKTEDSLCDNVSQSSVSQSVSQCRRLTWVSLFF